MLISNQKELNAFCASLKGCEFITVDTEFLREKTYYPKLCLIQIGDPDGNAAAIDVQEDLDLTCVFDLFADENIMKVFHAARQDLEIFYNITGTIPQPIFDTQIAAMVCGYGDSVGYENLIKKTTGEQVDKSSQFTNWSHRPLSDKQIAYAIGDVTHLVHAYRHLLKQLEKSGRTHWVFEEEESLNDERNYANEPGEAWTRIKIKNAKPKVLAVLRELAAWRERMAQDKDIPRNWLMRDETLIDMAYQMPSDEKGLKKIRNISGDMCKGDKAQNLIKIIKGAMKSDQETWPFIEKKKPLSSSESAIYDILRMLLKVQAAEHGVAAKLIADKEDIEKLATQEAPETPVLKGWRFEVFGKHAMALKKGELFLGLDDGEIVYKSL